VARKQRKPEEEVGLTPLEEAYGPGHVHLEQVRPGCVVQVGGSDMKFRLLYKTAGSAYVVRQVSKKFFGGSLEVSAGQRVALRTVVRVLEPVPQGFKEEDYMPKEGRASEGSVMMGSEGTKTGRTQSARPNKAAGPQPDGPYAMVEALLVERGVSADCGEVFRLVKEKWGDEYRGSKDSVASKKSHLKKKGALK
jgi:hypothetical protein